MRKEEVIHIVKELLVEAGLLEDYSISEKTNELADIMIYKGADGIEQFAVQETPMFPFEMIENILFLQGEEDDYRYNYNGTELQIIFELKGGARYVLELGDYGINNMLLTKNHTDIYDDRLIRSAINDYSRQNMIREHIKRLFLIIAELRLNGREVPEEADVNEVKKTVWRYIKEHPQDSDFIFSFAGEALQLRLYENDIFQAEEIIKRIVERGEEDSFMLYLEEEYGDIADYYLRLTAEALRISKKVSAADS